MFQAKLPERKVQSTPVIADPLGGEDLVSVIARVRKSGVREKKIVCSLTYEIICKRPRSIVVSTILYLFLLWTIKD